MRFKPVPEPPETLDGLRDAQRAIPLVPSTKTDCLRRLRRRAAPETKSAAQTWLGFLRALELVERTPSGYVRTRTEPTPARLRTKLAARLFGADAILDALEGAAGTRSAAALFDDFRDRVPAWETYHDPHGWEAAWERRHERLLEWFVLAGAVERQGDRYRLIEAASPREYS
ncbi:hypothetical protein ACNS7O_03770 [Haloferacaceae archaeon DSL9]